MTCAILSMGCPTDDNGDPKVQACVYDAGGFPENTSVAFVKPAHCPYALDSANENVDVSATLSLPVADSLAPATQSGYYTLAVTDFHDTIVTSTFSIPHRDIVGTNWVIQISGTYQAGHGGVNGANSGYDKWHSSMTITYPFVHNVTGISILAYSIGTAGVHLNGPTTGFSPGTWYDVSGYTDDPNMVGPVTWTWYVNGSVTGTSSDGRYSFQTGAAGTQQEIDALITDANSLSHWATIFVSSCTDNQIIC